MPSELNRRALFAAAAAFLLALAVAYVLSSTGQASPGTGAPGSPAEPLDVASGIAGQATLGEAQGLPALVRKPKPKPPKEEEEEEEPAEAVSEPVTPVTSGPTYTAPQEPTYTPPAQPEPEPEPQVFSDSG
jgi:outer membrane biosynthesis protein TonB